MGVQVRILRVALFLGLPLCAAAQVICPPRPTPGSTITNPPELHSQNGILAADLALRSEVGSTGQMHYCYVYMDHNVPVEAPTLRLNPGDQLVLNFRNYITSPPHRLKSRHAPIVPMAMGDMDAAVAQQNPCLGGMLTDTSTNIHFHGLNVPPVCHQDEVVNTIIQNNGVPFQYSIEIPANDPPGLYWYHPHPHGFSAPQVYGGAAGALIIEGSNPADARADRTGRRDPAKSGRADRRRWPVHGEFRTGQFPPGAAAGHQCDGRAKGILAGSQRDDQRIPHLAGAFRTDPATGIDFARWHSVDDAGSYVHHRRCPPAGRAEFIVPALALNSKSQLVTTGYPTGPIGDPMPPATLAKLAVGPGKIDAEKVPAGPPPIRAQRFSGLASVKPTATAVAVLFRVECGHQRARPVLYYGERRAAEDL